MQPRPGKPATQPQQIAEAVARLMRGEEPEALAREIGVQSATLSTWVDEVVPPESLRPIIEAMAADFGYTGNAHHSFDLSELGSYRKAYNPDCVWFTGEPTDQNTFAIFEVDGAGVPPKHRAGAAALANVVALKYPSRQLRYFSITPRTRRRLAASTIELLKKYLGDKWALSATVVGSFNPRDIRLAIRESLTGERASP